MIGEFESALRGLLNSVIRDVLHEVLTERVASVAESPEQSNDAFLLNSREAAERLSISQRHLYHLTQSGVLPCVRVGRLVRYSTDTIRQWIRNTESGEVIVPPARRTTEKPHIVNATVPAGRRSSRKTTARPPKKAVQAPASTSQKPQPARRHHETGTLDTERPSPFSLLLNELGVDRSALPPVTNGDLMRIAETDIAAMHGWLYHGRELPATAVERLREHFGVYRAH